MPMTKKVKDLQRGDKLALNENGPGVVTKCERNRIIEVVGDRAYEIEWRDRVGEKGRCIQAGNDLVETAS